MLLLGEALPPREAKKEIKDSKKKFHLNIIDMNNLKTLTGIHRKKEITKINIINLLTTMETDTKKGTPPIFTCFIFFFSFKEREDRTINLTTEEKIEKTTTKEEETTTSKDKKETAGFTETTTITIRLKLLLQVTKKI